MLTQTSETAIRALIYLVLLNSDDPVTPRQIAENLETSPTYMAKITRQLVRGNILRSHRGAAGGVSLSKDPAKVTLLEIIEASQGLLVGNYCEEMRDHPQPYCSFHQAMKEAHLVMITTLSKWTLADLARQPGPDECEGPISCRMGFVDHGKQMINDSNGSGSKKKAAQKKKSTKR